VSERICYEFYKKTDPPYRSHIFRYYCARGFVEQGWKVLDLGCGCGKGAEVLGEIAGAVLGVDYDLGPIEHANKEHSAASVKFCCCRAEDFTYPSPAEMTVMIEALEHFDEPEEILKKVKKNTLHRIFITIPLGETTKTNPHHKSDWTVQKLVNLMKDDDWYVIDSAIQGNRYFISCWQRREDGTAGGD